MTPADRARSNAISLEAKKDRMAQRQSNDWAVTFTVQGIDMDQRLTAAPMGTRYAMVLVEIGDDEQPVVGAVAPTAGRSMAMGKRAEQGNQGGCYEVANTDDQELHERKAAGDDPTPRRHAREKMDWRDLQPAAQAGIRCAEPMFRAFLREVKRYGHCDEAEAAVAVRDICGIKSRADLGTIHGARVIWHQLDTEYQAWLAKERVGA